MKPSQHILAALALGSLLAPPLIHGQLDLSKGGSCDTVNRCFKYTTTSPSGMGGTGDGTFWISTFPDILAKYTFPSCGFRETCFAPGPCAAGLAADGEFVYLQDLCQNLVYKLEDSSDCAVVSSCRPPDPSGYEPALAWDGEYLWLARDGELVAMTPPPACEEVKVCPTTGAAVDGLSSCSEGTLAVLNTANEILLMDTETCAMETGCSLPGGFSLAYEDGMLFGSNNLQIQTFDSDCAACQIEARGREREVRPGDLFEFELRVEHNRLDTVTVRPWAWIEDLGGEVITAKQLALTEFRYGDLVQVRGSFVIPPGQPTGVYGLYFGVEEMRQGTGIAAETFQVVD